MNRACRARGEALGRRGQQIGDVVEQRQPIVWAQCRHVAAGGRLARHSSRKSAGCCRRSPGTAAGTTARIECLPPVAGGVVAHHGEVDPAALEDVVQVLQPGTLPASAWRRSDCVSSRPAARSRWLGEPPHQVARQLAGLRRRRPDRLQDAAARCPADGDLDGLRAGPRRAPRDGRNRSVSPWRIRPRTDRSDQELHSVVGCRGGVAAASAPALRAVRVSDRSGRSSVSAKNF